MSERRAGTASHPIRRGRLGDSATRVEVHSIDYIPLDERHGKVWHQGPFWFMGNFILTTVAAGFAGPLMGLSLGWSVVGVVAGVLFGTFFMAFHAVQGPRMGLPQMVQSRAQFGYRGAIVPLLAVFLVYVGLNVFNTILAAEGLGVAAPINKWVWYVIVTVISIVIAIVGHDLLHVLQRWLTALTGVFVIIITILALVHLNVSHLASLHGFTGTAFMLQFGVAASYQISYAPYVSDYSRYLPKTTSAKSIIWWVYVGAISSTIWLMALGSLLAAAMPSADPVTGFRTVGNQLFGGFGTIAVLVTVLGLITIIAVNWYGAMLTSVAVVDAFTEVKKTVHVRVIGVVAIAIIGFLIALFIPSHYLASFNNFLLVMLYLLIPWTAVNLVDYYLVRRGHYAITEIFNPNGIYHKWSWRGLTAFFVGFAVMAPFVNTSFYEGFIAKSLNGVDISIPVGLPVAGAVYFLLCRTLDKRSEREAVQLSEEQLAALSLDPPSIPQPSPLASKLLS
jgi:nucleobase:cation symporter-1, NCS1 family